LPKPALLKVHSIAGSASQREDSGWRGLQLEQSAG
jgi:hypothetical protein